MDDALSGQFTDVVRTRPGVGSYAAGRFVGGAATTATIRASVQPMPTDEQQDLPEAARTRGVVKVFSVSAVQALDEATLREEDEVAWNGEQWRVVKVDRWQLGGLDHYAAVAVRVERA